MKDFFKIFGLLCVVIAVFLMGRNHGEEKFRQTEEYQALLKNRTASEFTKNDLETVRAKFQNIIDTAGTKKSDELLTQILQVFVSDLNLNVQNKESFVKALPASTIPVEVTTNITRTPTTEAVVIKPPRDREAEKLKRTTADKKKMRSFEWMLANAQTEKEIKSSLKNVEIKDLNSFLETGKPAQISSFESIFGSYRGRLFAVDGSEFSTLIFDIKSVSDKQASVKVQTLRNGRNDVRTSEETDSLGYTFEDSSSFLLNIGSSTTFYQVYKNKETNQLAGYFYERMVNGTTKTIGSFVLNRVDLF